MSESAMAAVREAAMSLSVEDRARLVAELWETLPQPPITSPEELQDLLARRMAEIDAGEAVLIPWDEARRQIWNDE